MSLILKQEETSVDSKSPLATVNFSNILLRFLNNYYNDSLYEDLVIVCVGTDRSTGDSLGPLIGYKLSSLLKRYPQVHVWGTLDEPVHAKNLKEKIELIRAMYNKPFVIAIDASLGKLERVGFVSVYDGPLKPGAGVNKDLPEIGHIHITGVVNLGGFMEYIILQNTRLSTVMKMAEVIANGFNATIWQFLNKSDSEKINN